MMYDEIKKTAKENNNMISLPNGNFRPVNPKHTLAQRCKECNAISHSEFEAEWMRQLELRYKNMDN